MARMEAEAEASKAQDIQQRLDELRKATEVRLHFIPFALFSSFMGGSEDGRVQGAEHPAVLSPAELGNEGQRTACVACM